MSGFIASVAVAAALFGLGPQEILIIAGVIVLMFGATKLPQLMRGMGQGIKEFKQAVKDDEPESSEADGGKLSDGGSSG